MKSIPENSIRRTKAGVSATLMIIGALALLAIPSSATETMISPMHAMTAQTGEVMVNGGSMMGTGHTMLQGCLT